ncbi:hypothetical protein MKX03_029949 [Papaver bracteatum]|nr:hypothetical protein MKX03_029949 [Papaver bracteatum]
MNLCLKLRRRNNGRRDTIESALCLIWINLPILHNSSGHALLLFTFYIAITNDFNGFLGISRILKLRNELLSQRGTKIRNKESNGESISSKGFSTSISYIYSSLSEVSQWCHSVASIYRPWRPVSVDGEKRFAGFYGIEESTMGRLLEPREMLNLTQMHCKKGVI